MKLLTTLLLSFLFIQIHAQQRWINVDSAYGSLPENFHVYYTNDSIGGNPFIAYYATASLKDKSLLFQTDTTLKRRLTPTQFYQKNHLPLLVVNTTFFSFQNNSNVSMVIKDGKTVSYNIHTIAGKGKDTLTYFHPFPGAIGIKKNRKPDIAWTYTDSSKSFAYQLPYALPPIKDSLKMVAVSKLKNAISDHKKTKQHLKKWKMYTAVGGGPILIQNGAIAISNNQEMKFSGKAINDLHPRTLMGYTADCRLIIMVIQGRTPGKAAGATLAQAATLLLELGCIEALNLDGGGSSCMLINGKQTIQVSDKEGERPVPAVFIVKKK